MKLFCIFYTDGFHEKCPPFFSPLWFPLPSLKGFITGQFVAYLRNTTCHGSCFSGSRFPNVCHTDRKLETPSAIEANLFANEHFFLVQVYWCIIHTGFKSLKQWDPSCRLSRDMSLVFPVLELGAIS